MKLQLAVDLIDLNETKQLLESVVDLIDIIEVGTPLVLKEGARAIAEIKRVYPERDVLADFKIMDAGDIEAQIGFDAGADIVTVLGAAENATVQRAIDQARTCGKQIMVDLIAVEHVEQRAREIDALGADILCVHTAFDVQSQGRNPLRELQMVHPVLRRAGMAVAGGVKPETVAQIAGCRPDIVVVGGFIATHPHPRRAASEIREAMDRAGHGASRTGYRAGRRTAVDIQDCTNGILDELGRTLPLVSDDRAKALVQAILDARAVFVAGAGRSRLAARCFAMRLMHLGVHTHVVGEVTAPGITAEDLLLIGSGSGATASLVAAAEKARSIGAKIALITIREGSLIGDLSDIELNIPAPTPKIAQDTGFRSIQPMGSLFEQCLLLLLDALILPLMERTGTDADAMFARHANLE